MTLIEWVTKYFLSQPVSTNIYYAVRPDEAWRNENIYLEDSWDIESFKGLINQRTLAVLNTSKQTIFHYLLTDITLFPYSQEQKKSYSILSKNKERILINNGPSRYWTDYFTNHDQLKADHTVEMIEERAENCKKRLAGVLLEPYKTNNDAFKVVLLSPDNAGNTALFSGSNHIQRKNDLLDAMFTQVATTMEPLQKEELLVTRNQENKTLLHAFAKYWNDTGANCFGKQAVKTALCLADDDGNTPFHTILSAKDTKRTMFQEMCDIAKSREVEVKEFKIEKLFSPNKAGLNPFHLVCKRPRGSAEDPELLKTLLDETLLPNDSALKSIMEENENNYTAIHYAIKSGQIKMAEMLLDHFKKHKKNLAGYSGQRSLLLLACQSGNSNIINDIIDMLNPAELYTFHGRLQLLEDTLRANSQVKNGVTPIIEKLKELIKPNKLFDCLKYLESNTKDELFNDKLNDFYQCWIAIEAKASLPAENPKFREGLHVSKFFQKAPYYQLREKLQEGVSEEEIATFRNFITQQTDFLRAHNVKKQSLSPVLEIIQKMIAPPAYQMEYLYQPYWMEGTDNNGYLLPVAYPVSASTGRGLGK